MPRSYGIDIHGTLACRRSGGGQGESTLFPLLEPLMRAWMIQGDLVYIVSGPPEPQIQRELAALGLRKGIHFHGVVSVVDFLKNVLHVEMTEIPGKPDHWQCDDPTWYATKGAIAKHYGLDIIIDDQTEYEPAMPEGTSFVHVAASLLEPRPRVMCCIPTEEPRNPARRVPGKRF